MKCLPRRLFFTTATGTDSSAGNTGFTDSQTQKTQTTVESTLSKRAIRNTGGQGDEEKGSVTPEPPSYVHSELENFPSSEGNEEA